MRKRLVKQGHSTLTVTIPAKWVQENRLKAGDELELEIEANTLLLSTTRIPAEECVDLDVTRLQRTGVNWLLAAAYKRGYDLVRVRYKSKSQLKSISDRIKDCLKHYEIVEQAGSSITIKAISHAVDEDFSVLLRRIFLVNLSFFRSVQEALHEKNYDELLDAVYLEETNDSLVNTCQRMIVKNRKTSHKDTPFLYVIIWQLEKIADSLKHLCQDIAEQKGISGELSRKFREIVRLYEQYYHLFYAFDQEQLDSLIRNKKYLLSTFRKKDEDVLLRQLTEQILDLSGPFFALQMKPDSSERLQK